MKTRKTIQNKFSTHLPKPSCPVLLGSMRIRTKVKLLLPPRNLQWILRRFPKNKSKNMKLFGSGKSFLWTVRTKKEIIFLVSPLCMRECFKNLQWGTPWDPKLQLKCKLFKTSNCCFCYLWTYNFKCISNHFIAPLKRQWPSIVYRKGRG